MALRHVLLGLALLPAVQGAHGEAADGVVEVQLRGANRTAETDAEHISHLTGTAALDHATLAQRKMVFGGVIAGTSVLLLISGICVLKWQQRKARCDTAEANKGAGWQGAEGEAKEGGGTSYKYQALKDLASLPNLLKGKSAESVQSHQSRPEGLGKLTKEEMEDALDSHLMSPEQRAERLNQWAQERAERLRAENANYLGLRKSILIVLTVVYIAASIFLPYLNRQEASCSHGFFWETHMEFLALFAVTKCAELCLMVQDESVPWSQIGVVDVLLKFLPSFLGYLDGYTDATAVFIAASCDDPLAHTLARCMAVAYLLGVGFLQWTVMFFLAAQDPSHACLLKLLHMDMLASCITLPAEKKWVWDLLAAVRTIGEDVPQAVLQTIYLVKVQRNWCMLLSVVMAVGASLKALHDARARALAAAGADQAYEQRERDFMIYSSSQDRTIRCWNVKDGVCTQSIKTSSPANAIAACNDMLYSAHDDDVIREWSAETGEARRTFAHAGSNAVVYCTEKYLFTWAMMGDEDDEDDDENENLGHAFSGNCVYKMWSLATGELLRKFPAPEMFKASMFVSGDMFFATSPDDEESVSQWNLRTGDLLGEFEGHDDEINAIYATSKRIFTGSQDGTVKEWSLETRRCARTFRDHLSSFLAPLIVVADKMYNASDEESDINEWSLLTGQLLRRFAGHQESVLSIVMLQEKLYSSSEDRTIKQWCLATGECEQTLEGHTDYISKIIIMCKDD